MGKTNRQTNLPTNASNANEKNLKKTKLFFPLLIASSELFCAYAKTVFYSAVFPYKSSYFTSELQQMH